MTCPHEFYLCNPTGEITENALSLTLFAALNPPPLSRPNLRNIHFT
uniref:Uncharacterized protein n=1 Tax=Oryza punctata TaxID=4537 RepID=A0A0E0LJZ6_ORYPU